MNKSSAVSGFYKLSPQERLRFVREFSKLTDEEAKVLISMQALKLDDANRMIENVIGGITLPFGIATNFQIDGKDYLIPMAIEEPSVVAAASKAASMTRKKGGFKTAYTGSIMRAQIQVVECDVRKASKAIVKAKEEILRKAAGQSPTLTSLGGGPKDVKTRVLKTPSGSMLIAELYVDCKDAMGANAVNSMAEAVAPIIERVTGGTVLLRILSNLATERLATATATFAKGELGGAEIVDGIIQAYHFADFDQYRGTTHNKGIMNGIIAVGLATGQDTRALEAAAHSYASMSGRYRSLTSWKKNRDGDLVGSIKVPIAVGIVGGSASVNPIAKIGLKILGVKSAGELSKVMASVGLAQNLAALRALVGEGIQKGHMKLHARNIAVSAGAKGAEIDAVARIMIKEKVVKFARAKEILEGLGRK
ncbi:MAG: hydroxymethylglutaryl-CoA reductase, degradative [Thaumarchaeota archaeon]|nr:hydroxymethylglutaryl-CoA reductase, degradative [Nitrososphaerota archaeon]